MKYVVLINGPAGAGKDTFIELTQTVAHLKYRDLDGQYVTVGSISAIDPVKDAARALGWDGVKDPASRDMLAALKVVADTHLDTTLKYLLQSIDSIDRWRRENCDLPTGRFDRPRTRVYPQKSARYVTFVCVRSDKDALTIWKQYEHDPDVVVTGVYIQNDRAVSLAVTNDADKNALEWNCSLFPKRILNNGSYGDLMNAAEEFLEKLFTKNDPLDM